MANLTITNVDNSPIVISDEKFEDAVINFAGADVLAAGTILARNTTTQKYQIYVKGGSTAGNGVPVAVLTYELTATGSGDLPCRPLVAGVVDKGLLIIDADGDGSNVNAQVTDELRQTGIVAQVHDQLSALDNQ